MSSIAGLSGLSSLLSFDASKIASQLISTGDTNGDAALSFSEFMTINGTTSSGTSSQSISSDRMTNLFNAIDTDSDGSLTASELEDFGEKLSNAMTAFMLSMQEQSQSNNEQATSGNGASQSKQYDPLDTNKDGIVSMMERLAGAQDSEQAQGDRRPAPERTEFKATEFRSMLANSYQSASIAQRSSSPAVSLLT